MIIECCRCEEGLGLWHTHCYDPPNHPHDHSMMQPNGWVQISVDWRAVARALVVDA